MPALTTRQTATSPPVRRPRDRKVTIIDAAARLFAQRGFAAVSIDEIGAEVGISGPAIYRHYRSKEALLSEVVSATVDQLYEAAVAAAAVPQTAAREVVRALVTSTIEQPAPITSYLREWPRSQVGNADYIIERERVTASLWRKIMRVRHPGLTDVQAAMRQRAVMGGVSAAALGGRDIAEDRFAELLVESAHAVITTRPRPARRRTEAGSWRPNDKRRATIFRAAMGLFAERGFAGVGIDEIGEAVGISGPSIYRHYGGKSDILVQAYDLSANRVAVGVEDALRRASSAEDALARMARSYAAIALDSLAVITVTERENAAMPPDAQRWQATQGEAREGWRVALRELRPDLHENEVRLRVRTVFPFVNQAARAARGDETAMDDVAALALAHVLGREPTASRGPRDANDR